MKCGDRADALRGLNVAPFAGAWIEIGCNYHWPGQDEVAPFAGAWIEIGLVRLRLTAGRVAPFAGAWIEIASMVTAVADVLSLPSRERGLKSDDSAPRG